VGLARHQFKARQAQLEWGPLRRTAPSSRTFRFSVLIGPEMDREEGCTTGQRVKRWRGGGKEDKEKTE